MVSCNIVTKDAECLLNLMVLKLKDHVEFNVKNSRLKLRSYPLVLWDKGLIHRGLKTNMVAWMRLVEKLEVNPNLELA